MQTLHVRFLHQVKLRRRQDNLKYRYEYRPFALVFCHHIAQPDFLLDFSYYSKIRDQKKPRLLVSKLCCNQPDVLNRIDNTEQFVTDCQQIQFQIDDIDKIYMVSYAIFPKKLLNILSFDRSLLFFIECLSIPIKSTLSQKSCLYCLQPTPSQYLQKYASSLLILLYSI